MLAGIAYLVIFPHPGPVQTSTTALPASCGQGSGTVYIQYTDPSLIDKAKALMSVLNEAGYNTPGIESRPEKLRNATEIRYHSESARDQAYKILACLLKKQGYSPIVKPIDNLSSAATTFEVWLSKGD